MRAVIQIIGDDDLVAKTIEVPAAADEYRWRAAEDDGVELSSGVRLVAIDYRPFLERKDARDPALIEEENSRGGHGRRRAKELGIKHRSSTPKE